MVDENAYYYMEDVITEHETDSLCFCSDCKDGASVVILTNTHNSAEERVSNCCYARAIEDCEIPFDEKPGFDDQI